MLYLYILLGNQRIKIPSSLSTYTDVSVAFQTMYVYVPLSLKKVSWKNSDIDQIIFG